MPPLSEADVDNAEQLKEEVQRLKARIRRDKQRLHEVAAALASLQRRPIGIEVEHVTGT